MQFLHGVFFILVVDSFPAVMVRYIHSYERGFGMYKIVIYTKSSGESFDIYGSSAKAFLEDVRNERTFLHIQRDRTQTVERIYNPETHKVVEQDIELLVEDMIHKDDVLSFFVKREEGEFLYK